MHCSPPLGWRGAPGISKRIAVETEDTEAQKRWEHRYRSAGSVWSGEAHPLLAELVEPLPAGTSLDLASGEGADVIWLAQHGWTATGVDFSPTATRRARQRARDLGLSGTTFVCADLSDEPCFFPREFSLLTAFFFHPREPGQRERILRMAAESCLAPGGRMLVVAHADSKPGSKRGPHPVTPQADVRSIADGGNWQVLLAEVRERHTPQGIRKDSVVYLKKQ